MQKSNGSECMRKTVIIQAEHVIYDVADNGF